MFSVFPLVFDNIFHPPGIPSVQPWSRGSSHPLPELSDCFSFCNYLSRDSPDGALDSGRLTVAAAAAALAAAGGSASERAAAATGGGAAANSGNEIRFFKNGRDQKVAFSGVKPGGCLSS